MDVNDIRNCFSKGSVTISPRGISVFYTFKERWVSQSIFDDSIDVFRGLLKSCDVFGIDRSVGKFVKFLFYSESLGECETVFYNPTENEVSLEELQEIAIDSERGKEHAEFFIGVDLDNDDEVLARISEWVSLVNARNKSNIEAFMPKNKWRKMKSDAEEVARILGCAVECNEPSGDYGGDFTMCFAEESPSSIRIQGEEKKKLEEFIEDYDGISIELYVNEGFLNISFFL